MVFSVGPRRESGATDGPLASEGRNRFSRLNTGPRSADNESATVRSVTNTDADREASVRRRSEIASVARSLSDQRSRVDGFRSDLEQIDRVASALQNERDDSRRQALSEELSTRVSNLRAAEEQRRQAAPESEEDRTAELSDPRTGTTDAILTVPGIRSLAERGVDENNIDPEDPDVRDRIAEVRFTVEADATRVQSAERAVAAQVSQTFAEAAVLAAKSDGATAEQLATRAAEEIRSSDLFARASSTRLSGAEVESLLRSPERPEEREEETPTPAERRPPGGLQDIQRLLG